MVVEIKLLPTPSVSTMSYPSRARSAARGVKRVLDEFVSVQRCLSRPIRPRHLPVLFTNGRPSRFFATDSPSSGDQAKNAKYRDLQKKGNESGSLLDTHMDRAGAKQAGVGRPGSDGVFYLGIRPGDYKTPKNYKKWKELGVGGKGEFWPIDSWGLYAHSTCLCWLQSLSTRCWTCERNSLWALFWDRQWQELGPERPVYSSFSSAEDSHYCWHTH